MAVPKERHQNQGKIREGRILLNNPAVVTCPHCHEPKRRIWFVQSAGIIGIWK